MLKLLILPLLLISFGCANLKTNRDIVADLDTEGTEVQELSIVTETDIENAPKTPKKYHFEEQNLDEGYQALEQIPVEVNVAVEKWLDYFTGRGRKHMTRYLSRSSRYLPIMKNILKQQGLPEDLVYVALIESGFNATAYSHASAVGYWQFIRGTAKRYGLRIDSYVDERRDFVRSTQAAGQYLKALYNLFGEWYLAIAAYNVGENRIKRLVMRYYTRDFWELARRRKLPRETINYVPKYIAAKLIAKNPAKYGFSDIDYQPELSFQEIEVTKPVHLENLAKDLGLTYEEMQKLNPMYRSKLVHPLKGKTAIIKVPLGRAQLAKTKVENHYVTDQKIIASMQQPDYVRYRVRRGDTLGGIARKFRTRISTIKRLNRIRGSFIRIGQRLRVPARNGYRPVKRSYAKSASKRSYAASSSRHRIRRGENLSLIATKYNVSIRSLKRANGMRSNRIYPGRYLKIPGKIAGNQLHTVRAGETLIDIAKRYKTSVRSIANANNLQNKSYIQVGKKLIIPD